MGLIFLDTSVLIAHLRGHERVTAWLDQHTDRLAASSLVAWELLIGARSAKMRRQAEAVLAGLHVEALTAEIVRVAADEQATLRSHGQTMSAFDMLIAAQAVVYDAPLATLDGDFERIDGLEIMHP